MINQMPKALRNANAWLRRLIGAIELLKTRGPSYGRHIFPQTVEKEETSFARKYGTLGNKGPLPAGV